MNRPPEFDKTKALDAAVNTIWTRGYNAASLSDLIEAMGLSKSSFYNSFGNKHQVLLDAIDVYTSAQAKQLLRLFNEKSFHEGLNVLFESVITDNNGGKGCLLVNCASEVAPHDAKAAARVREGFAELARVFAAQARRAIETGELHPATDPVALANSIVALITGLRVLAKGGVDGDVLRAIVRQTLGGLIGHTPD